MASKSRDYFQDVPVGISARCVLRLDLYTLEEAKRLLEQLFRRYEEMCEVEIIDHEIRENHWHVILVQRFTGHDPKREKGIAAWVRNVRMMSTRTLNAVYSTQGCLSERVYRSVNLKTNERLLAYQAYVQANGLHHANQHPDESTHGSWRLYGKGEATGVETQVPEYCVDGSLGKDNRKFMLALQRLAMKLARELKALPWLRAAQEMIAAHAPRIVPDAPPRFAPVTDLVDEAEHRRACEALDDWELPRVEFQPRRAPSVGSLIEIRIRRELDPVALFPE